MRNTGAWTVTATVSFPAVVGLAAMGGGESGWKSSTVAPAKLKLNKEHEIRILFFPRKLFLDEIVLLCAHLFRTYFHTSGLIPFLWISV